MDVLDKLLSVEIAKYFLERYKGHFATSHCGATFTISCVDGGLKTVVVNIDVLASRLADVVKTIRPAELGGTFGAPDNLPRGSR